MTADLVIFGKEWGVHPSGTEQIVRRLNPQGHPQGRRMLWVNATGRRGSADGAPCPGDIRVLTPRTVPMRGNPLARQANRHLLGRQVQGAMADLGIARPILWASWPTAVDAVGRLGERAVVYQCDDDISALEGGDRGPLRAMEDELVERADLVLASSPTLAARFPRYKTIMVPHGVDMDLFATPAPRASDLPDGFVAGFYGGLTPWVDTDLIAAAAEALPHWTFFLIGPIPERPPVLSGLPNLVLAGPRPHESLPDYSQHWTASILPLRDTPRMNACTPLKLREYLAAGTPVVATGGPALEEYREVVAAVSGADWFIRALAVTGGNTNSPERVRRQRACVAGESWDKAARLVADALDRL
ncbi:glycosyltransferase [Azospirillum canadense]|uniref:glycosyltransferase n=1 Tax=Azospirillum canadense TaxID=403962 RepID=UPI0022260273|nr:glycosyltransferase [Azospirillum canadense]MCW2240148.1 glycosyltransferase involved in cell wall biosynthesis [Azospirillum canadense]